MSKNIINLDGWQDYRGDHASVLLYVETSHQAALPIRDQLNENGKGHLTEPNYETSTYGMAGCFNTKVIHSILKNKHRYILFGTRYQGVEVEYQNKYLVHGYMRIDKVKDMRAKHIRTYMLDTDAISQPECMNMEKSMACWSGDMKFYALADCFELSEEVMKRWGYKGRVTRQMKLLLEDEKLDEILAWFADKKDISDEYCSIAQEFKNSLLETDEDSEEEEGEDW